MKRILTSYPFRSSRPSRRREARGERRGELRRALRLPRRRELRRDHARALDKARRQQADREDVRGALGYALERRAHVLREALDRHLRIALDDAALARPPELEEALVGPFGEEAVTRRNDAGARLTPIGDAH